MCGPIATDWRARPGDRQRRQRGAETRAGTSDSATSRNSPESWRRRKQSLAESEAAAQGSEAGHVAARAKLEAARAPLNEADKRVQRLETEAAHDLEARHSETKNLWPPIIDGVTSQGYEKAIGAASATILDAPVDPSAPMR